LHANQCLIKQKQNGGSHIKRVVKQLFWCQNNITVLEREEGDRKLNYKSTKVFNFQHTFFKKQIKKWKPYPHAKKLFNLLYMYKEKENAKQCFGIMIKHIKEENLFWNTCI
jgi:hypothetical protein